jgi:hypothetical protein
MLIPFGVLSAAAGGAPAGAGDYELIESYILGSDQASITFSNLGDYSSTYKHLQIRYTAHSSRSGANADPMKITLNSTTQLRAHHLFGNGSSVGSGNVATDYAVVMAITGNDAPAEAFAGGIIDILDSYSASKNKTLRTFAGAANFQLSLDSTLFDVGSITTINLTPFSNTNFFAGSRFSIYGIKG